MNGASVRVDQHLEMIEIWLSFHNLYHEYNGFGSPRVAFDFIPSVMDLISITPMSSA